MIKIGTVSYNIYCNFTNYGSALQTWALHQAVKKISKDEIVVPVLVDYCPEVLIDKNPLAPFSNMWDKDDESRKMCELSMPSIRENYKKFDEFYHVYFNRTKNKYTSVNFNDVVKEEEINGFICGSDTIFCIDEFDGFDDGYYANYDCMQGKSVSYAASFGDSHFTEESYVLLNKKLHNFKAIGLRENEMLPYVAQQVDVPVQRTLDPTLLLEREDYEFLVKDRLVEEKYLLLYARRYNAHMEAYAEKIASEKGWKIVEISLRASNAQKVNRQMYYEAGVEEFLSLMKYAEMVITNSFHGVIFATVYCKPFYVFTREQCNTKISELLKLFGLQDRLKITGFEENRVHDIDYNRVYERIAVEKEHSIDFLRMELKLFCDEKS